MSSQAHGSKFYLTAQLFLVKPAVGMEILWTIHFGPDRNISKYGMDFSDIPTHISAALKMNGSGWKSFEWNGSDGLPWNCTRTFVFPSGRIVINPLILKTFYLFLRPECVTKYLQTMKETFSCFVCVSMNKLCFLGLRHNVKPPLISSGEHGSCELANCQKKHINKYNIIHIWIV